MLIDYSTSWHLLISKDMCSCTCPAGVCEYERGSDETPDAARVDIILKARRGLDFPRRDQDNSGRSAVEKSKAALMRGISFLWGQGQEMQ